MAKKTKEETLDLFYFNSDEEQGEKRKKASQSGAKRKNDRGKNLSHQKLDKKGKKSSNKKNCNRKTIELKQKQEEDTKEEKFNFDEEIIIGLRRIDDEEDKQPKHSKKQEKEKNYTKELKQNKSKGQAKNRKKEQYREDGLMDIPQIGVENRKNGRDSKQVQKKRVQKKKPEKKLSPQQELTKKKRKVIFRITKWLLFFTIIIGAGVYALLSPIFNVKKIDIIGNSKVSSEEIESLSGIVLEQNMFQYRKEEIGKKIKENAYIDTVKVSRKIPDTMQIVVTERKASFIIQIANAYAYISSQGYVLEISSEKPNLPILTGLETEQENIQAGLRLCTTDLEKLGDVLKIMEAATSNKLAELITKIDVSDTDNCILILQSTKKTVYLGDTSNLSTKMLWILTFNKQEKNTQGDIILNMNLNDEKNKPYFREKM